MVSDIWVGAGLQKNIHHDRRATIRQDVQRRLWKLLGGGLFWDEDHEPLGERHRPRRSVLNEDLSNENACRSPIPLNIRQKRRAHLQNFDHLPAGLCFFMCLCDILRNVLFLQTEV